MAHAIILGASGGIGGATARALAARYDLTLAGRDGAALQSLRADIGGRAVVCDVRDELETKALFDEAPACDVLVYAVGAVRTGPLRGLDGDDLRAVVDANLTGLALTLKHGLPRMNDGGQAFVLGARPELVERRGFAVYAAAKAGAAALVRAAAQEARKAHLTMVLPAAVNTPFWDDVGPVPKNAIRPEEVAEAIAGAIGGDPPEELRVP
ncbi:MAG: SDR family NAD(P)-dependent oxidoreductase [Deinococcus-Thermus bacterium]|jgi:NAD(P)-dependent dehydrogenase (short-subunit alcohol dehydrogenase family)|nr:SDR family NAD(P)-dependent oxidoreductase [Deinococcota bacterium]